MYIFNEGNINSQKEKEVDMFIYSRTSVEDLLKGLLKKDENILHFGGLDYKEKVKYTLFRYIKECKVKPEKLFFYIIKILSDEILPLSEIRSDFKKYSVYFPPLIALSNFTLNDFKKLSELYENEDELKDFFMEKIILSQAVQNKIMMILRDPELQIINKINWAKYHVRKIKHNRRR